MQQLVAYTEKDTLSGGRPLGVVEGNVLQQAVGHCCSSAKEMQREKALDIVTSQKRKWRPNIER